MEQSQCYSIECVTRTYIIMQCIIISNHVTYNEHYIEKVGWVVNE